MSAANATCDYVRGFGNWSSEMCPGITMTISLPEPTSKDSWVPGLIISNAELVVNVSKIANCAGNFRIGTCNVDDLNGKTFTYFADKEREKLPLIIIQPGQCVKIETLPSKKVGSDSCVGDPTITLHTMLIGDYCVEYPTSELCEKGKFNPKATARPPPTSHAASSIKQSLLVVLSTVAIVLATVA